MSEINQNTEPLFIFDMPDDEVLSQTISVQGEKGERGDPTKTSQLTNDSDFTTNAALAAGLATKANQSDYTATVAQVNNNASAISTLNKRKTIDRHNMGSNFQYALLATLWARSNTSSAGSFTIHGRLGGYRSNRVAHVDITIADRSNGIKARGSYYESGDPQNEDIMDVVVYYDAETDTDSIYLRAKGFVAWNLDISSVSPTTILYNGEWSSTEPTGTLAYSLLDDDTYVQKNINGTILANITGDAGTVNGHTVDADVPVGAVFTDTIYDDSAIYDVLDTKADAGDVISNYATKRELQSVASGSPLVASSISGMTDTSRIYVNTTDGHWYYYDGSAWTDGGVYQAAEIEEIADSAMANKGLTTRPTAFYKGYNLRDESIIHQQYAYDRAGRSIDPNNHKYQQTSDTNYHTVLSMIPRGAFITVRKSAPTNRFIIGVCQGQILPNMVLTILSQNTDISEFSFYNENYQWIAVYYTYTGQEATIDILVDNRHDVLDAIRDNTLGVFEKVESSNLYDPTLKVSNIGTRPASVRYVYTKNIGGYRTYPFVLTPNTTYNITKTGGNKFRVCLWRSQPIAVENGQTGSIEDQTYFDAHPSAVVIDDDEATTCTFNSGNYLWCTILYSNASEDADFVITSDSGYKYRLAKQYISDHAPTKTEGGYQFIDDTNGSNWLWSIWNNNLAHGMNTNTAIVPSYFNGSVVADGMVIAHNVGDKNHNRWGLHLFEGYSKDNIARITVLADKFKENNVRVGCIYYFDKTNGNEHATAYQKVKLGSDCANHSFSFDRDEFNAFGAIFCNLPFTLARINPDTDLNGTYETVEEADTAYHPESVDNLKCLKYIYLKNAPDGTMWYDSDRKKVVVKINGKWHDVNTTELPDDTYGF